MPHVGSAHEVLGVDPGPERSGWCLLRHSPVEAHPWRVLDSGTVPNRDMLADFGFLFVRDRALAIERVRSYGMAVGREVFETCEWIGRFWQAWPDESRVQLVERREVKLHLCGSARAKDANIRQALLDLLGPKGTKKAPGPTYGVKSHAWSAVAVAVTAAARERDNLFAAQERTP